MPQLCQRWSSEPNPCIGKQPCRWCVLATSLPAELHASLHSSDFLLERLLPAMLYRRLAPLLCKHLRGDVLAVLGRAGELLHALREAGCVRAAVLGHKGD